MNAERRKCIDKVNSEVATLNERLNAMLAELPDIMVEAATIAEEIESIKDAEQEAYDNLSEGQQEGDRGLTMSDAIDALENAHSNLSEVIDSFDTWDTTEELEGIQACLSDAKGIQ